MGGKKEKSCSVISKTSRILDRMAMVQHVFYFALQISLKRLFPPQYLYNYVRVTQYGCENACRLSVKHTHTFFMYQLK
jgi:hypothetical protein